MFSWCSLNIQSYIFPLPIWLPINHFAIFCSFLIPSASYIPHFLYLPTLFSLHIKVHSPYSFSIPLPSASYLPNLSTPSIYFLSSFFLRPQPILFTPPSLDTILVFSSLLHSTFLRGTSRWEDCQRQAGLVATYGPSPRCSTTQLIIPEADLPRPHPCPD